MISDSTLSNTPFECPEPEPLKPSEQIYSRASVASIMISPNPADDLVNVTLPDGAMELIVFSSEGRVVFRDAIESKEMTIGTSEFVPGLYILMIRSRDNIYSHKISIIR